MAQAPRTLARLLRRLGWGHRSAGAGGPLAGARSVGLSWGRPATAPAQQRASGAHHRWLTGLGGPGAGGPPRPGSLAPPAGRDARVTAARCARGREPCAQAGADAGVADPRYAHRAAAVSHGCEDGLRRAGCPPGFRGGRRRGPAYRPRGPGAPPRDPQGCGTLLPGLPAVLPHPWGRPRDPQRDTRAGPLLRRLAGHTARHHGASPDRRERTRGLAEAPVPLGHCPLQGAPGAGKGPGNGHDGSFPPALGDRGRDAVRENHATLTNTRQAPSNFSLDS